MIRNKKNWSLIFITALLIIVPMILAIVTSYTLYLKYKIRNLEVKINELKEINQPENIEKNGSQQVLNLDLSEIDKFLNIKPKGIIEKEKVDIFYLIKESKSSFQNNEIGGITLMKKKDAFFMGLIH
ncbi:hypothetical protein [Marinitoga lauensis]|uniref:hypothetical protein n=1 Tax=Marinitoga lauensis TaxID=2201189 RepID=UPI001010AB93|nr:hypothetical protein [Marinitoga lauensis]